MEIGKLKSGFISALGGVNSSNGPELLEPNELSWAVNVRLRGGHPRSRPGFLPQALKFENEEVSAWWRTKVWQGAVEYEHAERSNFFVASVGGRLFTVDIYAKNTVREITPTRSTAIVSDQISPAIGGVATWDVTEPSGVLVGLPVMIGNGHYTVTAKANATLTLINLDATPGVAVPANTAVIFLDPNPSIQPTAFYGQAEEFLVIQDGESSPIIFNGGSCRRAHADEIPVGTVMKYHRGRIWLGRLGGRVLPGDIVGLNDTSSVLKFTEYRVITGGGGFRVNGEITAMVEMPALDSSLGGPLQVITTDTFNSFDLPPNRELWNTITVPFQTVSLKNAGAVGQNSVVVINGDVYFRSPDGWRSFVMARREFGTWANTPLSNEMNRVLEQEADSLLEFASATLFDNRFLFTVTPHRLTFNASWEGIGALDFHPLSGMRKRGNPIYDGLWLGLSVYQLITISRKHRCFAFTNEPEGIRLWEITRNALFDGNDGRISSFIELPASAFGNPFDYKKLISGHAWIANVVGTVDYTMRFRPDDAQCWIEWNKRNRCAKAQACAPGDGCALRTFKAGYKPHMGFGQPPETCAEFEKTSARFAYQWQFRLEWVGQSTIKRLLFTAEGKQDSPNDDCE